MGRVTDDRVSEDMGGGTDASLMSPWSRGSACTLPELGGYAFSDRSRGHT